MTNRDGSLRNTMSYDEFMRKDWTKEREAYEQKKAARGFRPGRHWIARATPVVSRRGTPGLELTLIPLHGPNRGDEITEIVYASPRGLVRIRALLRAAGKRVGNDRVSLFEIARALEDRTVFVPGEWEPWEPGNRRYDEWEHRGWVKAGRPTAP